MDPEQPQQETQQNQMTEELSLELITLLSDPKIQVKYAALNAIIQFTTTEESKLLFLHTDFLKIITPYIDIPEMTKLVLSTMIHFSSSEPFAIQMVDYIYPIIMKMRNNTGLIEELGLLLLLNVSKQSEFTERIFEEKEEGENSNLLSPFVLQILFGFMESKPTRKWVIANVFVNVTSQEAGRLYVANQKLYLGFVKLINEESDALRIGSLRILRNIAFLWENEEIITELLRKDNEIIDRICIHMLVMILKSDLTHDPKPCKELLLESGYKEVVNYEKQIDPIFPKMKATNEKSIAELQICIDIILILSNGNFPQRKPQFHLEELKKLIGQLNFTKISEETKDKLEALETFCFW